ncbi:hypothetical protein AKG08_10090 [Achromobacter piechaudii]|uniref:DUF4202 domain-containing protein n=1 Tax=Achromobacter piechaudii TaxID=72556 RepID=UPI000682B4C1|nr:DUF4202 domain-containing protein [Achromobacter piechaudii]KNY10988.1 hypothetical protein AKG08_10090 [Achromobacter piechaudii]
MNERLAQTLLRFDQYNGADPNLFTWQGETCPQELFLAQKLHEWVLKLAPDATPPLLLASRCQHIGRWEIARKSYPDGRVGYLTWRKALARHHASVAQGIMRELGHDEAVIDRVTSIVMKQGIKQDADVQTMENALCLVFLQYQYEAFHPAHPDKIVGILRKSLQKMDAAGHKWALTLPYSAAGMGYLEQALAA